MKQSSLRYLGLFDLLLVGGFVAVFGVGSLATGPVLPGLVLAGVLALLAGSVAEVSLGGLAISWRHLVGVAYAVFGLLFPASYLPEVLAGAPTPADLALFAVATVGSLSLFFVGFDLARGGGHFEIEPDVETVLGR